MSRHSTVAIVTSLVLGLGGLNRADSSVPSVLHCQGVLTDAGGTPITTNTSVTFTLWSAPIAGTIRWTETRSVTPDSEGRFAILLGQAVPLHDTIFKMPPLYLGVQVEADPELTPRSLLSSNAFAFRISTVDGATGGSITGNTEVQATDPGDGLGVRDPGGDHSSMTSISTFFEDPDGDRLVEIGTVGLYFVEPSTGDTIFLYNQSLNILEMGKDNTVVGMNCLAVGFGNSMSAVNSSAFGINNTVTNGQSTAVGNGNTVTVTESGAFGNSNIVDSAPQAFALGTGNMARGQRSFACGQNNRTAGYNTGVFGGENNRSEFAWSAVVVGRNQLASGASSIVCGGDDNNAAASNAGIIAGELNVATGFSSMIAGGRANRAMESCSFVGGGRSCSTQAPQSAVLGGEYNVAAGQNSSVTGGRENYATAQGAHIGGGYFNRASARYSTVAGGYTNQSNDTGAFVGGGQFNFSNGRYAAVAGGYSNNAGSFAAIPGGLNNIAIGRYSFAAGRRARTFSGGCFVWGDSTDADLTTTAANQFLARASGGVTFYSDAALTSGVTLAAGGGSWAAVSDRNVKENIEPVDGVEVLEKLSGIPIAKWNYTSQDDSIRHIGPMAQDFYAAFGVGEDDRHITTIDADGVALAAIQALYQRMQKLEAESAELRELNAAQRRELEALKKERSN